MQIEGTVALVTGANRGLGKAIVAALLTAGVEKVYAAARDESTIATDDPRIVALTLDVTKPDQVAAAAARAGDVTLLVNNAGVCTSCNVLTTSAAELDTDYRTHVHGMLEVVRAFLPALARAPGRSTIVNVLSLAALANVPRFGGYSASKAAAYSITQALRSELRQQRIDILAALPGPIDTDMVRDFPMPKTSPEDAARNLVEGIERGDEEIFPDPLSQQMAALWSQSPKNLERALAGS
jgi:NAD(P)-dependent dehydrogenase (short-subunit alcohol dehydrogenase family)